jgi:hypothetical protein
MRGVIPATGLDIRGRSPLQGQSASWMGIAGRLALVTGGSSGIGAAIAPGWRGGRIPGRPATSIAEAIAASPEAAGAPDARGTLGSISPTRLDRLGAGAIRGRTAASI